MDTFIHNLPHQPSANSNGGKGSFKKHQKASQTIHRIIYLKNTKNIKQPKEQP